MVDFIKISSRSTKRGVIEIYPKFIVGKSNDLMIRGGDFYAIWLEDKGLWSTDEQDALSLIDYELDKFANDNKDKFGSQLHILHMWDAESGMIDRWHKYCQKQMRDSFHMLDETLIFSNDKSRKRDYSSKRLSYPLIEGSIENYDKLMSVLYVPEEREKIEWAIGSIINGDSKKIQKFLVLYGSAGSGKSTVLNIMQKLFDGYYSVFDAKALGMANNSFALEAFKTNPLVAIQHDGDLSRIEDNTRLNSLVSHEYMTVNEKFKSTYTNRFKAFLFMGTNKPVKITDGKSGLLRRLIDVTPSGNKVSKKEYDILLDGINFELGSIAFHCKKVYENNKTKYDDYVPTSMMNATNDFYNFVSDSYFRFKKENGVSLKSAWEMYNVYCTDANITTSKMNRRAFQEELKNYFEEFLDRFTLSDGSRIRSYYQSFIFDKFDGSTKNDKEIDILDEYIIDFKEQHSILDDVCSTYLAQYANDEGTPRRKWENTRTKLNSIDTTKLHFVKLPINHIVIDFDLKDEEGKKSYAINLLEASKFPKTYAELSKSGAGIHLHYIYEGDPELLDSVYDEHIEIKVFKGDSSLRRKLTKCNDVPIATISSGLPTRKGQKKMIDTNVVTTEKGIRTLIEKNLNKEIHAATKPSIDFIYKILEDAYESGVKYDVSNLRSRIFTFALDSTNNSDYCTKLVDKMKFKSDTDIDISDSNGENIVFYDVEVFKNLFLVNWKFKGSDNPVVRMINPTPSEIENLLKYDLVGFNCRRYDNHIMYARLMGYTNEQLYSLSKKIISGSKGCFFGEAYNLSYTDVYDFSSKKQSLKKWEIELGIKHHELDLSWDEPVPESEWEKVAEYCDDDVIATEIIFDHLQADFTARKILAEVAGMTVNDTTNSLSTRIIFGKERNPQKDFNYRFMGMDFEEMPWDDISFFTQFDDQDRPLFPGYVFEGGKSIYRDEEVGEGGYVYSVPGIYENVALLDIESMHPSSVIAEDLFGPYTKNFKELKETRLCIKHENLEKAKTMLDGKLAKFLEDGNTNLDDLSYALKIVINSVYGLTSANFENPFRDVRNIDNIVAKRGALFMINLKYEVLNRGFEVAHIKTDSIKIPNATPEIIQFVNEYGASYGYNFEHEATYEKMCLVNDAVYIAKYASEETCNDLYGYLPSKQVKGLKKHNGWTATGTQFQIPYVFKTLFSKEDITFDDLCETKAVSTTLYLDFNEELEDVTAKEKKLKELKKDAFAGNSLGNKDIAMDLEAIDILEKEIAAQHNYSFVGKVGRFCPIKPGCGGAVLLRETIDKKTGEKGYAAATGSKGYRWLESDSVKETNREDCIDISYYDQLVGEAIEDIEKYGNFEKFSA